MLNLDEDLKLPGWWLELHAEPEGPSKLQNHYIWQLQHTTPPVILSEIFKTDLEIIDILTFYTDPYIFKNINP